MAGAADTRATVTMPRTEAIAWSTARRLGEFTARQLAAEAGVSVDTVRRYLRRWTLARRVTRQGEGKTLRYLANPEPPEAPPREQSPERNMWTAMRLIGAFGARDLALQATTDSLGVSEDAAARYIRALLAAGYLRVVQQAVPGRRPAVYRLIRNTGPQPPRECRVTAVWDQNLAGWARFPEGPR